MGEKKMVLPPGFQFDPTDEELIVYFLCPRAANLTFYPNIIPDLDIYAANPRELNDYKAFWSKREWYFFSGSKQNRCTQRGFWKEVGVSERIFTSNGDEVGIKIYLVFYGDDDGSNVQTNWLMEEYHLLNYNGFIITNKSTSHMGEINRTQDMNEWVLCRVHEANYVESQEKSDGDDEGVELSYLDEVFFSMEDDEEEISFPS